ncbi:hypothetical protein D3C71_1492610 [compost metagenome]
MWPVSNVRYTGLSQSFWALALDAQAQHAINNIAIVYPRTWLLEAIGRARIVLFQRGACCRVQTPWGDLPTVTWRTTFLAWVSTTDSFRAHRELT